jgi:type II secretory pathway component PulK
MSFFHQFAVCNLQFAICNPGHSFVLGCRRNAMQIAKCKMQNANSRCARRAVAQRRGMIFVTTLWVTLILAALVLVFARSMGVEALASSNRLAADQAAAVELGGEQWVLAQVDNVDGTADYVMNTNAEALPIGKGYLWLLRPAADETSYEFGLTDEASKLNISTAKAQQLIQLPGMTNVAADSIVDWEDPDESPTNGDGAESSYYNNLPEPYKSKNAAFETVEELRLVKGIDDQILFGMDRNRNAVVEPAEQARGMIPAGTGTGQEQGPGQSGGQGQALGLGAGASFNGSSPNRGIFPFVTVFTAEPNTDIQGGPRTNVNGVETRPPGPGGVPPNPNRPPGTGAPPATPRPGYGGGGGGRRAAPAPSGGGGRPPGGPGPQPQGGPPVPGAPGAPGGPGGNGIDPLQQVLQQYLPGRATQIMAIVQTKRPFSNLFDFAQKVGMSSQELRMVADHLTWTNATTMRGLINVNTAPREVLLTLPGLSAGDADALISQRQRADTSSIAWVADAMSMSKAALIGSLITNRSFFYSADIVAVSGDGRAFKRVRIVVDARTSPAKIVFRKDLTSWGWPLPAEVRDSLRSGHGPGASLGGATGHMGANRL